MTPTWQLAELVAHGVQRCSEARHGSWMGASFIFVAEIYQAATRISSRIEHYESIARFMVADAREHGRAFCLLKYTEHGWVVDDYGHCLGDRVDVNAHLGDIRRGAA